MSINDRLDAIGTITMEDQDELAEVIDNNFEFEDYRPTFNEAGEITGSNVADAIRALGYRKMTITTAAELDAIEARADEVAEWRKHFRAPQNRMDYSQRDVYVLLDLARKQQAAIDAVKAVEPIKHGTDHDARFANGYNAAIAGIRAAITGEGK